MNPLDLEEVKQYVNVHIVEFHQHRIASLEQLTIDRLLQKNPYLFKAKHIVKPWDLIDELLTAFLSSSEEKLFGDFLEDLAIFIAEKTCGGHKSATPGVDLEFLHANRHYLVSIKSGPHWGNSSQHKRLAQDLREAVIRVKQSKTASTPEPVLGICYGKTRTVHTKDGYLKVVGQNFWYLISKNKSLYTDIVEPIGYRAREHNERFESERDRIIRRFTKEFLDRFCNADLEIDWVKLVEFNSANFDLDEFPL